MPKKAFAAAAIVCILAAAAPAAEDVGRYDVSAAFGVAFGHTSTNQAGSVSVVSTNSPLFLGTLRYHINRTHGIALNYGQTRDSQIFVVQADNFRVQSTVGEYSAAYVLSPFHFDKLQPFVFGGVGGLRFSPSSNTFVDGFLTNFGAARQTALAFLYGGGFDYPAWKRLSLRVQYRGLVYKQPNFHLEQLITNARGHEPQATVGIVFGF